MILTTVERMERLRSSNTSGPFDSYILRVLLASHTPTRVVDTVARRWRWLRASVCDPYRPELHYMRGPGPKSREKHARGAGW